jgi:hypothetical protein
MQCALVFFSLAAADQAPPGIGEMFDRWYYLLIIAGAVIAALVGLKVLREPKEPKRRILPDPIKVKHVDDDYVTRTQMNDALKITKKEMDERFVRAEKEIGQRFEHTEEVFRERFHKLDNDLNRISLEAVDWHDRATDEFKSIEGKLGKLEATSEHTNAAAIRTDQAVRALAVDLPKQITDVLIRGRD